MTHPALIHGVRVHITRQPKEVLATWPVELPLQPGSRMRRCRPGSGALRRVACWPFSNPERPLNRRYARMDAPALPPSSMHSVLLNTCRTGAFSVPRSSSADRAYRNSLPKEGRYLRSHPDRSDLLRRQSARQHARGASASRRRSWPEPQRRPGWRALASARASWRWPARLFWEAPSRKRIPTACPCAEVCGRVRG